MSPHGACQSHTPPGTARQDPRGAQLLWLTDRARATSLHPKELTLPFLPSPAWLTVNSTGTQALLGLPPPSPLLPHAQDQAQPGPTWLTPTQPLVGIPPALCPSPCTLGWGQGFAASGTCRSHLQSKLTTTTTHLYPSGARRQQVHLVPPWDLCPSPHHRATRWVPRTQRYLGASPSIFQDNTVPIKLIMKSCNPWQPG